MPTRSLGAARLADRIAAAIYARIGAGGIDRLDAVVSLWLSAPPTRRAVRRARPQGRKVT